MKRNSLVIILNIIVLLFANISCDIMPMDSNNSKHKPPEPFEIQIEKTHGSFQGGHEYVDVTVNKGTEDMLGFDLLIGYDASALGFQAANPGQIFEECEWEYFTYRYEAPCDCDDNCPSGMIRIVGIAETNNGANHPTCYGPTPFTLCTIDFLVTDDRIYECMFVPIRFFWTDCGDNAVLYHDPNDQYNNPYNDILGISRYVYDLEGSDEFSDYNYGLPGYFGAPDNCIEGINLPIRYVDFYNGGIDIICADSIDYRYGTGDFNGDGFMDISDLVFYSYYFIYGLIIFSNPELGILISDINYDGIYLDLSDFVYMNKIIIGNASPYLQNQNPIPASVERNNGILSVTGIEVGAVHIVLQGQTDPELMVDNMEMRYNYDEDLNQISVLVYSFENNSFTDEGFIDIGNNLIIDISFATKEGYRVFVTNISGIIGISTTNYSTPFQ